MTPNTVTVRSYKNSLEAHLARTKLAEEDIVATVHRFSRYRAATRAGYLLKVAPEDAERAAKILGPEIFEIDLDEYVDKDDPAYKHCPKCGSANLTVAPFEGKMKVGMTLSLGILSVFVKRDRHCGKCGHDFRA